MVNTCFPCSIGTAKVKDLSFYYKMGQYIPNKMEDEEDTINLTTSFTPEFKKLIDLRRGKISRSKYVLEAIDWYCKQLTSKIPPMVVFPSRSEFIRLATVDFIVTGADNELLKTYPKIRYRKPKPLKIPRKKLNLFKDLYEDTIVSVLNENGGWMDVRELAKETGINRTVIRRRIAGIQEKYLDLIELNRGSTEINRGFRFIYKVDKASLGYYLKLGRG